MSRHRDAVSAAELGLAEVTDPELLRRLASRHAGARDWVLVTGDDAMPAEHGQIIHDTRATIATIHPDYPAGLTEHAWRTDVVHRWAHKMQDQEPGTVRRYSIDRSEVWRPRRRHRRQIAQHGWSSWSPASQPEPAEPPSDTSPPSDQEHLPGVE